MRKMMLVAMVAVLAAGCGREPADPLAAAVKQLDTGKLAQANAGIAQALAQPDAGGKREALFAGWLGALLAHQQVDEARRQYARFTASDAALGTAGFEVLGRHYVNSQAWEALADWVDSVAEATQDPALYARARLVGFEARFRLGALGPAVARIPEIVGRLQPAAAAEVLGDLRRKVFSLQNAQTETAMLEALRALAAEQPGWAGFAGLTDMAAATSGMRWDDAESSLVALAALPDEQYARDGLSFLAQQLDSAGEGARADRVLAETLERYPGRPGLQTEAAYRWMRKGRETGDTAVLLARLQRVAGSDVPAAFALQLYREYLYDVLRDESVEHARALVDMSDALAPRLADSNAVANLNALTFDAAFVAADYARVLAALDAGIPGRDPDWHAMARNKILAHQALADGNWAEAAARFRDFMVEVDRTWTQPEEDPSSGLTYTKEMALGFNAGRIGDLMLRIGATNEAAAAYQDARRYYETAQGALTPDSREFAHVTNAVAQLPPAP